MISGRVGGVIGSISIRLPLHGLSDAKISIRSAAKH